MLKLVGWYKQDKLKNTIIIGWLITVFSSFWDSYLLPITISPIGTMFLFRFALPITFLLYVVWIFKTKQDIKNIFWSEVSSVEKWCYILILSMITYSFLSLFRAIDFEWTFRKIFNLCFVLCFFFLFLRLCKEKDILKNTLKICLLNINIMLILGIYEAFINRIFYLQDNEHRYFQFFKMILWSPVVTSGNENDYSSMLIFILAIILLYIMKNKNSVLFRSRIATEYIVFIDLGIAYFLVQVADGRLVTMATNILLIVIIIYALIIQNRKGIIKLPIIFAIAMVFTYSAHNYIQIRNTIEIKYLEISSMFNQQDEGTIVANKKEKTDQLYKEIEDNKQVEISYAKQLYKINEETGEKEIRDDGSVGIRARLLIRALKFIPESYGLGIGVGNSEKIIEQEGTIGGITNIHCFIARIVAEYGIFVIIPFVAIGVLILKDIINYIALSIKCKDRDMGSIEILFLFILAMYPFLSTASSDAQNQTAMWIYLGFIAIFNKIKGDNKNENTDLKLNLLKKQ